MFAIIWRIPALDELANVYTTLDLVEQGQLAGRIDAFTASRPTLTWKVSRDPGERE